MSDPPWQALPPWRTKERRAFEFMNVDIDYGPGVGVRPFRILPWLTGSDTDDKGDHYTMHFVATVARQGRIRIGKHQYDALLAQPYRPSGRFDRPTTALFLKPVGKAANLDTDGFSGEMLTTVQRVDGQLYTTSATPLGDKLTVRPYRGDFGVVRVGPGGRKIKDCSFNGSLESETMSLALAAGSDSSQRNLEWSQEYRVPVGDYVASYLHVRYGQLGFTLSENYHSDGRPRSLDRPRVYFIKVRKDKPFVVDFANNPAVLFASPAKDAAFKPGDEITVKAVLIDPVCDIMIRGLSDSSKAKKETVKYRAGKEMREYSYDKPLSLDPMVTISNSAGKKVAEGVMPFG